MELRRLLSREIAQSDGKAFNSDVVVNGKVVNCDDLTNMIPMYSILSMLEWAWLSSQKATISAKQNHTTHTYLYVVYYSSLASIAMYVSSLQQISTDWHVPLEKNL